MPLKDNRRSGGKVAALALPYSRAANAVLGTIRLPGIRSTFEAEIKARRLFLLQPILFALGILAYFNAPEEPLPDAVLTVTLVAIGLTFLLRKRAAFTVLLAVATIFAGFTAGMLRADWVRAPKIHRPLVASIAGTILEIDHVQRRGEAALRILVVAENDPFSGMQLRVTLPSQQSLAAGNRIAFKARLLPPSEPSLPGGYDFEREAYFAGLGAVGTALGPIETVADADQTLLRSMSASVDRWRNALGQRILRSVPGEAGALCMALVTGKRGLLSEETNAALRASGLYHIVSISGLHMALLSGLAFALIRRGLALCRSPALSWPLKPIAAAIALLLATMYCVFSGAEVATVRSWIMVAVMLGAVIIGRPALSMRNVAIAAWLILAIAPETLLGPSFQMSFAAVAMLIASYEWIASRRKRSDAPLPMGPMLRGVRAAFRYGIAVILTTLVASIATAPFAIAHFQRISLLGLIGNLLAIPIVSFVVMPAALLGPIALPFGFDSLVWHIMGEASALVLAIAQNVAALPDTTTAMPSAGLPTLFFVAAILVFCVFSTWLRSISVVPALIGIALQTQVVAPIGYISPDGRSAAFQDQGQMRILGDRPTAFVAQQWKAGLAITTDPSNKSGQQTCDTAGCTIAIDLPNTTSGIVALVRQPSSFAEDCQRADLVITLLDAPAWCKPPHGVIDRATLDQGAISIARDSDHLIFSNSGRSGHRLWQMPETRRSGAGQ
jgi:competence protein ComEC